jgi:hypothetical protein
MAASTALARSLDVILPTVPARFSRDHVFEFDTEDLRFLRDDRPQLCNSILPHLLHALRHSFPEVIEFGRSDFGFSQTLLSQSSAGFMWRFRFT